MNAITWLLWALVLVLAISVTRNPFYLSLAALAVATVWIAVDTARPLGRQAPRLPLLAAGFLLPWSTAVNALLAHIGDRVLFRLPAWPVIGGPITLNAALYGLLTGIALTTALAGTTLLHAVIDRHQALRAIPPNQRVLATTLAIALNALPAFATAARDAVEASRLRGLALPRWRQLQIVVTAILYRGIDYSLFTAEVLETRSFAARHRARPATQASSLAMLLASFAVIGGSLAGKPSLALVGVAGLSLGSALIVHSTWRNLRTLGWSVATGAAASLLLAASTLLVLSLRDTAADLAYSPYPALRWPGFSPLAGLAFLLLASPALFLRGSAR